MSQNDAAPTAEDKARYDKLKEELVRMLMKKRGADKQLAQIEVQIYNLEGNYLLETAAHSGGNIIQGFDGYLKNQTVGRRKHEVSEADRMFSTSSLTYQKSLELSGEGEESTAAADEFSKQPTPGLTTVIVPPATRTQELTAAQNKKARDREYQRRKRANAARGRSTGTISDEDSISVGRRPTKRQKMAEDD
ncbi:hypothetical protein SERLA73DRAFT_183214 [Serpula lacrymans var. lacrymans S7.3]|uniref:Chromatin modification-related protein EAF6 n=2 Tax=Serpula lacrymans var. lacrymans TaxID=341189 RepID=F8PZG7_SERL3|nr:hypothetical protein SERLA73DRAFT_183214 [Serpula lacrymans var. lacrymans S7.3]